MTDCSIRTILREKTQDIHEQLHELDAFRALFSGSISQSEYCDLLLRFYAFYAQVDGQLLEALEKPELSACPLTYEPRAPMFARDLLNLGCSEIETTRKNLPPLVPLVSSRAELGGILYVIEGSTMGGSIIYKALAKCPRLKEISDTSYWAWCQRNGQDRWQKLLCLLNQIHLERGDVQTITKAAIETFEKMADALISKNSVPA